MEQDIRNAWEAFLNPQTLRKNIIEASVYSMAYETLKNTLVDRIRDFFLIGFDEEGYQYSPSYKEAVLSLDKSPLLASIKWLQNMGAIEEEDISKFKKIRQCRNTLIHEMSSYVSLAIEVDIEKHFSDMIDLISKVEKWWIINVEIEVDPDIDPNCVDHEKITPGPVMFIKMLSEIALGPKEVSQSYFDYFQDRSNN